jgi:uncharacterized iron-regulated protein
MRIYFLHITLILLFGFRTLFAQEGVGTSFPQIYNAKTKQQVTWKEVLTEMDRFDVLVWGEEHDDTSGHAAQLDFFRVFNDTFPSALSLEMLERDQQSILDEFYRGFIPEKQMIAGINHWKNFQTDYLPLVKHAKEGYSPILCSNPPRRYVNAVARKGIMAYSDFSEEAHSLIPAAYTLNLYPSETYLAKLRSMFGEEHGGPKKVTLDAEYMILAQYMWDQGMAESVSREIFRSGRKIFHINGRFHSDEEGGVVYRLRKMGHKVLVLSAFPEGKEDEKNFAKLADFVILTTRR